MGKFNGCDKGNKMTDLLERIRNLSPNKRDLLLKKLSHLENPASMPGHQAGAQRLSAFLVTEEISSSSSQQVYREYLKNKLPDYMVPSELVILDALPLTPNGKIDRIALQQVEVSDDRFEAGEFIPPRTETEEILAQIWKDLIGFDEISIHDNFFEIGGDSLISIRIIARANEAGLNLTPQLLFEYPTIAELAALLEKSTVNLSPQEIVHGDFTLLPIQQWFMEWEHPEQDHWNQAVLLETPQNFDDQGMQKTLQSLVDHHDTLRMSVKASDNGWIGHIAKNVEVSMERFDISSLTESQRLETIAQQATKLHRSLNIQQGTIFRAAYFHLGPDVPGRLLLIVHHLAIDWVSWGVLLDDLSRIYRGFLQRSETQIPLPAKTTSIKTWAEHLKEYANSPKRADEIEFWASNAQHSEPSLPVDYSEGENTVASEQVITVSFPADVTLHLLNEANHAYQTRVEELLLTALVKTFLDWTNHLSLRVGLEGHGREPLFDSLDLSRTVGWFTSYYPVWLRLEHPEDTSTSIKQIKEQLRSVPKRGVGYGILRYLADHPETEILKNSPYPQVLFNYLGRTGILFPEDTLFKPIYDSPAGEARSSKGVRRYLFEINSFVQDERLNVSWIYSQNIYDQETVKKLSANYLSNLNRLVEHCLEPDAGGFTPSDFPLADLDDGELDKLSDLLDQID